MSVFYNTSFIVIYVNLHLQVKKKFVIPLLMLYMIASTGFIINLHYCGEQIESWAVIDKAAGCEDDPCDETDTRDHDCCQDKSVSSKISVEQDVVSFFKLNLAPKFIVSHPAYGTDGNEGITTGTELYRHFQAHAPPGNWQAIPLYKLHSSFTYYG